MVEILVLLQLCLPLLMMMLVVIIQRLFNTHSSRLLDIANGVIYICGVLIVVIHQMNWFSIGTADVGYIGTDNLSNAFAIIAEFFFLLVAAFSYYYISNPEKRMTYWLFLASLKLAMLLVIYATHLFLFFIFWEVMVLSGYILVSFEKTDAAYEAGFKYLVMSTLGSMFLLLGIALITGYVVDLSFVVIRITTFSKGLVQVAAMMFMIIGLLFTAGGVFFNLWLPDAHPTAPAPVSALLSGLLVKIGIYGIYRILSLFSFTPSIGNDLTTILVLLAVSTMIDGNIMVFAQFKREMIDFKRVLAYSTIVQLGYLLFVISINSAFTLDAIIYQVLNHGLAKVMLFLLSGVFIHEYDTRDLRKLKGVGRGNGFLSMFLYIPLLSLAGFPFTGGFYAKFLILLSAMTRSGPTSTIFNWCFYLTVINMIVAFFGYLWIIYILILSPAEIEQKPLPKLIIWFFILLSILIVLFGIIPTQILSFLL